MSSSTQADSEIADSESIHSVSLGDDFLSPASLSNQDMVQLIDSNQLSTQDESTRDPGQIQVANLSLFFNYSKDDAALHLTEDERAYLCTCKTLDVLNPTQWVKKGTARDDVGVQPVADMKGLTKALNSLDPGILLPSCQKITSVNRTAQVGIPDLENKRTVTEEDVEEYQSDYDRVNISEAGHLFRALVRQVKPQRLDRVDSPQLYSLRGYDDSLPMDDPFIVPHILTVFEPSFEISDARKPLHDAQTAILYELPEKYPDHKYCDDLEKTLDAIVERITRQTAIKPNSLVFVGVLDKPLLSYVKDLREKKELVYEGETLRGMMSYKELEYSRELKERLAKSGQTLEGSVQIMPGESILGRTVYQAYPELEGRVSRDVKEKTSSKFPELKYLDDILQPFE